MPKVNTEWWREKIARNVARDRETDQILLRQGWTLLRFWEHTDGREIVQRVLSLRTALSSLRGTEQQLATPE